MLELRHHLVDQHPLRRGPGLVLLGKVEGQHQQRAEAARVAGHSASFWLTVRGDPTSQLCSTRYSGVTSESATLTIVPGDATAS